MSGPEFRVWDLVPYVFLPFSVVSARVLPEGEREGGLQTRYAVSLSRALKRIWFPCVWRIQCRERRQTTWMTFKMSINLEFNAGLNLFWVIFLVLLFALKLPFFLDTFGLRPHTQVCMSVPLLPKYIIFYKYPLQPASLFSPLHICGASFHW